MSVVYVTQPGAEIRKKGGRLQVQWKGQLLSALPMKSVERLVLLGPVQMSAAATRLLLQARIPVIFSSMRGKCYGLLSGGYEDIEMLMAQVQRYEDESYRLNIARSIVSAKINHQLRLLRRHARNHPHPEIARIVDQLGEALTMLVSHQNVAAVMGVEGHASALYFSVFGHCLRQEGIDFKNRNRRPPKDPVNAILSLGYMLVYGEVLGALIGEGLHPGLGFLHEVSRRRPALALDLLELARQPIVDRLALSLFNRQVLTREDFDFQSSGEVRLKEKSLKRYFEFYERVMTTEFQYGSNGEKGAFRDWMRLQVQGLKNALAENRSWKPGMLDL